MKRKLTIALLELFQISLGMAFVVGLFMNSFTVNQTEEIENSNLDKMADTVTELFVMNDVNLIQENIEEIVSSKEIELNSIDEIEEKVEVIQEPVVPEVVALETIFGTLTGYGPDCVGCGNFKTNKVSTSSGYYIADIVDGVIQSAFTTTYDDSEYGKVRIVAADKGIEYYSIVRISNIPNMEPIIAIVLDRGGTVGIGENYLTTFDLLFESESIAMGKQNNIKFEILRRGN